MTVTEMEKTEGVTSIPAAFLMKKSSIPKVIVCTRKSDLWEADDGILTGF